MEIIGKIFLLKIIGFLLFFSRIYFLLDKLFINKGMYILMYHRIGEKNDDHYFQDIAVKKDEFEKQLNFLTKKYCYISMSEAVSIIEQKSKLD